MESIEVVVSTLWRASWQASILVLLVLLAQGLTAQRLSPAWRSALWLLVVVRLLLPVTPSSGWSVFNLTGRLAPSLSAAPDPIAPGDAIASLEVPVSEWNAMSEEPRSEPVSGWTPPGANEEGLIAREWPVAPAQTLPETAGRRSSVGWLAVTFWVWLAGVVLLSARLAWGTANLARRTRCESPVRDPGALALLEECRAIMGTRVRLKLAETDQVDSPALFGFWRLNLLLPPGTLRHLNRAELRYVFLHELAHVRRGDVLLNWLITLLQVVYWFNPVIWFAFARMRADREMACDAMALARAGATERAAYGATILKLVSGLRSTRPAPGLVGISEGKSNLERRIRMIASHRNPSRGSFLAIMILVTLALVSLTDARATREMAEPEEAGNEVTVSFGSETDEALESRSDVVSSAEDRPPASEDEHRRIQAAAHVQAGKALYEMGLFSEAESEMRQADILDPENQAAFYYLKLISEAKYVQGFPARNKLRRIVFNEVQFDGLRLPDVLDYLARATRDLDPDGSGVNFLINPSVMLSPTPLVVDPIGGRVITETPVDPLDMNSVIIRIVPPIRNVSLADVLDAVVRVADQPIHYTIEDYGVVFAQVSPAESRQLETRIFKVRSETFLKALDAVGTFPLGHSNQTATDDRGGDSDAIELPAAHMSGDNFGFAGLPRVTSTYVTKSAQEKVRDFFRAAGVDVMPPNQIYFNERKGVLMVRATPRELDIIQQAIEVLTQPPPQITFELLLVEFSRSARSDPELDNVNGSKKEGIATGILTERQFKAVLRQLENRPGVRMASGPRTTTLSDREMQIQADVPDGPAAEVELRPVVRSNRYDIDLTVGIRRAAAVNPENSTEQPSMSEAIERRILASTVAVVRDGQTLVVGGLDPADFRSTPGDAQELRDLPVVGRLFRDETVETRGQLLLFITPTIIDPAGNRVHGSDRLPFDPDTIPEQQPKRRDDG